MAIIECGKGHIYDNEQNGSCPYCKGAAQGASLYGAGKTMPLDGFTPLADAGKTLPPLGYSPISTGDDGKTQGVMEQKLGFVPVVGWLVCVEGPERGKDHRIYAQVNSIGRSDLNDISIKGDATISTANHAKLSYSEQTASFFLAPAENKNIILLNKKEIFSAEKLSPFDVISFGISRFLFIPLCGEKFIWKADGGEV